MKITKRQLRRIIQEEAQLQESFIGNMFSRAKEVAVDMVDPQGWLVSGAGLGVNEQKLRDMATDDAWKLFKAMGGIGTDESTVREVLKRRAGDLKALHAEFDELRKSLVEQRGKASTWILQLMFAKKGKRLEGAGLNYIMKSMQDKDLVGWLESDGMDEEAAKVSAALSIQENTVKVTKRQLRKIINQELVNEGWLDRLRSKAYGKAVGMTTKSDKLSGKAAQLDFAAAAKDRIISKVESLADEAETDMTKMGIGSEDPELFDELNDLVKMLRDAARQMRR